MDIIGTITLCPEYGGVHISEAPGTGMFPVGMAMDTHAVKYYDFAIQSSSLLYVGEKS